jgi:hypothetical protein
MRRRLSPEDAGNYMVNVRKYKTFIMLLYSTSLCACAGAYLLRTRATKWLLCANIKHIALFKILLRMRRRLSPEDAGNYMVNVRNKFGEKANHVRLSMKVGAKNDCNVVFAALDFPFCLFCDIVYKNDFLYNISVLHL